MTKRSPKSPKPVTTFIGVDGCPSGWASLTLHTHRSRDQLEAHVFTDAAALLDYLRSIKCVALIDMPIGLPESGKRACETEARALLKERRSSIFPAPRRPMLSFNDYAEANAWGKAQGPLGGGGLSKQAWNIVSKIKELDAALKPDDQEWLGEGHPELAFSRLRGEPCRHAKRTQDGSRERKKALKANSLDPNAAIDLFRKLVPTKTQLADDDILDACVLSLSARARYEGQGIHLSDGTIDERGFSIEMWG